MLAQMTRTQRPRRIYNPDSHRGHDGLVVLRRDLGGFFVTVVTKHFLDLLAKGTRYKVGCACPNDKDTTPTTDSQPR